MYVCGITPYDATHIGHAATYVLFDTIHRFWLATGHSVRYVQNVTDIDDPLLERAARDGVDWRELADFEIQRFRDDMVALRVLPPTHLVGAVESVDLAARRVMELRDAGAAYPVESDLYFSAESAARFGRVSHLTEPDMVTLSAERGETRSARASAILSIRCCGRRRVLANHSGTASWDRVDLGGTSSAPLSPWSSWARHSTCRVEVGIWSSPSRDERGAGEVLEGWPFARAYIHAPMVSYEGSKMSKSLGNLVFVSRLRESGVDPMTIRLAILSQSYREDWPWSPELLDEAAL